MIHQKDKTSSNPRLQCVVCRKWQRAFGRDLEGKYFERFYGACKHNHGNDHLAQLNGDIDVCDKCCDIKCKQLST